MWNVKQVQDDAIKMAQLITIFKDRVLTWSMKYSSRKARILAHVRDTLISEFKKPKSKSQCITELKEIKKKSTKIVWEFEKKFKNLLDQVSFKIAPQQHQEWFIATLLLDIRLPLM